MYKKQGPFFNLAIVIIYSTLNSSFSLHLFHLAVLSDSPHKSSTKHRATQLWVNLWIMREWHLSFSFGRGETCVVLFKLFRKFFFKRPLRMEKPSLHQPLCQLLGTFWKDYTLVPLAKFDIKLYFFYKCWNFQKLFLPN
jgi:hypothetical protein